MIFDLLKHVPGCENGEPPFSQELIAGGKVNRSYLVRTQRGRFVIRLNENDAADLGVDRHREHLLHGAAAQAGLAPRIVYASPEGVCLVSEFLEGRQWTPHYFTRMRDLRSLGQRLHALHGLALPSLPRFDPLVASRRYVELILRTERDDEAQLGLLLDQGAAALERSGSAQRAPGIVHMDIHHGNVLTADRVYFVDFEYAQVGDPLLDLACVLSYYPRAMPHAELLLAAAGFDTRDVTPAMLTDLTYVFTLLVYLWYRARRLGRVVPSTELQLESAALRRLSTLAPGAQPRHTSGESTRARGVEEAE
jgi:thiamine kinase-like enzyme